LSASDASTSTWSRKSLSTRATAAAASVSVCRSRYPRRKTTFSAQNVRFAKASKAAKNAALSMLPKKRPSL
jgi:hypothetical protein